MVVFWQQNGQGYDSNYALVPALPVINSGLVNIIKHQYCIFVCLKLHTIINLILFLDFRRVGNVYIGKVSEVV